MASGGEEHRRSSYELHPLMNNGSLKSQELLSDDINDEVDGQILPREYLQRSGEQRGHRNYQDDEIVSTPYGVNVPVPDPREIPDGQILPREYLPRSGEQRRQGNHQDDDGTVPGPRALPDGQVLPREYLPTSGLNFRPSQIDMVETDEIYPINNDFGKKNGETQYVVNTPVPVNDDKEEEAFMSCVEPEDEEEGQDGIDSEDKEPRRIFDEPRDTEYVMASESIDDVNIPMPKTLHGKLRYLCKAIHYNKKDKMDAILNSEHDKNQLKLLTMKDQDGLTCLMKAVTRQSLQCVRSLLHRFESLAPVFDEFNVDKLEAVCSKDGKNLFHLAAKILNGREVMDELEMCHLKEILVDRPDRNGETPLITACTSGNHFMAKRLLSYGAKIDHVDKNKLSPIYLVCLAGPAETLSLFLENGAISSKHTCSMTDGGRKWPLLSNSKLYKNGRTILSAIAEGGTENTLETCFASPQKRALIQQCIRLELRENPMFFHNICGTSLSDLVELVINYDNEMLVSCDETDGMTPLMRATEAGQFANVKMILDCERGRYTVHVATLKDKKTALMIACARGYHEIVRYIVASCDVRLYDVDTVGRNAFHYAAKHHEVLSVLIDVCASKPFYNNYKKCLMARDDDGDISLYIAAVNGSYKNVKLLLEHGVPYDMTSSRMDRSSLHYAACANLETVKVLVDFVRDKCNERKLREFINAGDCKGQTCLHLAASLGHWQTVAYLLENGAEIIGDNEMETPLHHAAAFGSLKTTEKLLEADKTIINHENRVGETAAMFAAVLGKTEVLQLLLKNKACLWARKNGLEKKRTCLDWAVANKHSATASAILDHGQWKQVMKESIHGADGLLAEMVRTMPSVALKVLDKCVTTKGNEKQWVTTEGKETKLYDFFPLQTVQEFSCHGKSNEKVTAMKALEVMAHHSSDDCLRRHMVVQKFLGLKWRKRARVWYLFDLVVHTIFLIALTVYINLVQNDTRGAAVLVNNNGSLPTTNSTLGRLAQHPISPEAPGAIVATVICAVFACVSFIKEIFQLLHRTYEYFLDLSTYMKFGMYVCVVLFFFPLVNKRDYQWQAGAIAIFLAWLNFIGFIKNFSAYGIYIIMAKKIFLTFVKVFISLGFFIMAFAMAFFVLLRDVDGNTTTTEQANIGFKNIIRALVTTFAMMVGEIGYRETFLDNTRSPHFALTLIFLVLFMILMTILVMNLLTGLAVGDTGEIMRRALTEKRIQQALLIVEMDKTLNRYPCFRARYIEQLRETPGQKTTKIWTKFTNVFFPDLSLSTKEDNSSLENELKDKMDEMATQLEAIQKMLKKQNEDPFVIRGGAYRGGGAYRRGQGYSL